MLANKPNQPVQARVEKLVSGGQGLIRVDGQVSFVWGVLPSELVELVQTKTRKDYSSSQLLSILEPSPSRVMPRCRFYGRCGGCNLMHASYELQQEVKRHIVQESFYRIAQKRIELPVIHTGTEWGYRHRLQLHKEGRRLGFKERSTHRLIEVDSCPVAAEGFLPLWQNPKSLLTHPGQRITIFAPEDSRMGFFIQGKTSLVSVTILKKRLTFSLEGFFQSNLRLLPCLIEKLLAFLAPCSATREPSHALDLFCGCGLFGAFLADHFSQITCVEANPAALKAAKMNLQGQDHHFFALSLEDWLKRYPPSFNSFSAVVVDPPRNGLSGPALTFLSALKAQKLAYVSCNPDTMARDISILEQAGWKMTNLELFDFYPQTSHIEALGCLER